MILMYNRCSMKVLQHGTGMLNLVLTTNSHLVVMNSESLHMSALSLMHLQISISSYQQRFFGSNSG